MSKRTQEAIKVLEADGCFEWRTYSGRGMMGKECLGVSLRGHGELWELALVMGRFGEPNTDSMGKGIIAYWPNLKIENKEE